MKQVFLVVILALLGTAPLAAQDESLTRTLVESAMPADAPDDAADAEPQWAPIEAGDLTLDQFLWVARPVVVFADNPNDPSFIEQIELLSERPESLEERDIVVIYDASPADRSPIRTALRPRGFSLVLIDKDGRVAQRKPSPWTIREISATIDKMPMRQQELRDRR